MSPEIDQHAVRLAQLRRWRRVLAGWAGWGWVPVIVIGAALQAYSKNDDAGPVYLVLLVAWLLCIVGWLVLAVLDRRSEPDLQTSLLAEQQVATARPIPWVRLTACAVLAVVSPLIVQDLAAAGAGVLHAGRQVPFTAQSAELVRSGWVVHGYWVDGGPRHAVAVMDALPQIGQTIQIRRPPLGGGQVYAGNFFSYVAVAVLLAVLVAFVLLLRSTQQAVVSMRAWQPGRPPKLRGAQESWRGLEHQVTVRPHAGLTRKGEQRKPNSYDRNVSFAASGKRFVIVDRLGHPHELALAHGHSRDLAAVAELAWISYVHHDSHTGDSVNQTLYVLDGRRNVLAVVASDDWDQAELSTFAGAAGLGFTRLEYASRAALDTALPVRPRTLRIDSWSRWAPVMLLLLLPVVVVGCIVIGIAIGS